MDNLRVSADSKPDSLLRLVGVDKAAYQAPQVNAPGTTQVNSGANTVAQSTVSARPMQQALASTQKSLAGSLEQYNQSIQQQAQRKLETVQAEQQAALKRSMVQAAAAAQNGEVISSLAQTAAQYLIQRQQANVALQAQAAEALKQQRKSNFTAATVAVHELKSEAENGGYKEKGTTYYTQKFQEQVYTADIDDEDRLALVQDFYKHRDSYEQQSREARDKSIKELRVAAREREKQQSILELQPVFSAVKDNPYADPEVAMSKLREKIAAVYGNPDYTPTEKDDMAAALFREAAPYVGSNVQAQVKLAVLQQDVSDYKAYEADQVLQYQNGQLNRQKLLSNLQTFKHIKGLGGVPSYDPKADMEFQQFIQESTQKNTDYTLKRSREAADNVVQVDDQAANAYAIQLATSMGGSGIAELEARGMDKLTRGEQVVLFRAKKIVELREKEAQLSQRLGKETQNAADVNYSTTKKAIDAANRGKEENTLVDQAAQSTQQEQPTGTLSPEQIRKLPENLRAKVIANQSGKKVKPYTPEELAAINNSLAMQQQAAAASYNLAVQELESVRKELASFGLSSDMEATRKYMSDGLSKWQQYQKNWTDTARGYAARQATPQNNQELGVMSPF